MTTQYWVALACLAILPFISSYAQAPNPAGANLSPAATEVAKLAGAGTGEEVMLAYVQNAQTPFHLSADHVLYLKDVGVPTSVVTAMLNRDAALHAQAPVAAPAPVVEAPPPAAAPGPGPETGPPAAAPTYVSNPPADVAYFYHDLSPYGTWVDLPGSGWCWQPSVVSASAGWQPYCHGGHWLNTDAGWFWASDYSWGWAPFHYGRWHRHPTAGWVWFPGREWGPAWVVWRSGGDHCGWAPLPPHADFVAGVGWRYNGVRVSATFDFGLSVGCFSFVSLGHFCDHDLYARRLPPAQVTAVYHNTTVINNYTYVNNTYVNHGINVTVVEKATGQKLQRVPIHDSKTGGGAVAGAGAGAFRRPLGTPTRVTGMTALKIDNHGRIPATLPGSAKFTSTSGGGQNGKFTGSGEKRTGSFNEANTGKLDGKVHSTTGTASSGKYTATSGSELTGKANPKSGTGSGSGNPNPNLKLTNTKGSSSVGSSQADANSSNKRLRSDDVRGATGLTSHDNKNLNYSTSGSGQKNSSGSSSSKGSTSSNSTKDQTGKTGAESGASR